MLINVLAFSGSKIVVQLFDENKEHGWFRETRNRGREWKSNSRDQNKIKKNGTFDPMKTSHNYQLTERLSIKVT